MKLLMLSGLSLLLVIAACTSQPSVPSDNPVVNTGEISQQDVQQDQQEVASEVDDVWYDTEEVEIGSLV